MIAEHTATRKGVVITGPDFDRLRHLVESPRYRVTHAALLQALRAELDRCQVVEPGNVPDGVVTMHTRLVVRDSKTKDEETFTLVFPEDADIDEGKLSVLAPLGTALLGTRVGQVVEFDAPGGKRRLRVEKVLYQPEAAGHFHL
jgi:regulator of nucleoside diphosphate kinase